MWSHDSTSSPSEYRMGSVRVISRSARPVVTSFLPEEEEEGPDDDDDDDEVVATDDCSRSFLMSLSERDRPVPSYPFTVDARKTR